MSPRKGFDPLRVVCPMCGDVHWSLALGTGHLKMSGIFVGQYDSSGESSMDPGIELAAFTCQGCGYVRLHDPSFVADAIDI